MNPQPDPSFPHYRIRINAYAVFQIAVFSAIGLYLAVYKLQKAFREAEERVAIAQAELHTVRQEAVALGVARWEGVDQNVSYFVWKDPDCKLPTYQRPNATTTRH